MKLNIFGKIKGGLMRIRCAKDMAALNIKTGFYSLRNRGVKKAYALAMSKKTGSQTLDFLIIALIVVIIGAALMLIMKTAMPDLFQRIITKINTTFDV